MKKPALFWITSAVVAVVVIVLVVVLVRQGGKEAVTPTPEAIQQNLEAIFDEAAELPAVEVPSVNPLEAAVPDVNPAEKINPFKLKNPFE